jgi:hypothetical protein
LHPGGAGGGAGPPHAHDQAAPETSGALVLREKAERVRAFHDRESEARGSWRGASRGDRRVSGSAWRAGERDGQVARLGEPELRDRRALG